MDLKAATSADPYKWYWIFSGRKSQCLQMINYIREKLWFAEVEVNQENGTYYIKVNLGIHPNRLRQLLKLPPLPHPKNRKHVVSLPKTHEEALAEWKKYRKPCILPPPYFIRLNYDE